MSNKYTYSITDDFPNQKVNLSRLTFEINESTIDQSLDFMTADEDDDYCYIWFQSGLTVSGVTTLSGIVLSHSGEPLPSYDYKDYVNYGVTGRVMEFVLTDGVHDYISTINASYEVARSFHFPGTNKWHPSIFGVIGSRGDQSTTGYARLYDKTNDNAVVEISWTEEDKNFYLTTSLYNLSDSPAIIELQCKTSAQDKVVMLHHMILE